MATLANIKGEKSDLEIVIDLINEKNRDEVTNHIEDNWGSSIIVSRGKIHNINLMDGYIAIFNGEIKGIITYSIDDIDCEIISLDSFLERRGIGSTLINKVVDVARKLKCKRVWLITTNDNIDAIKFYQKRLFNMVYVHKDAILESRRIKPQIPRYGCYDIPIMHEVEFEMILD